MASNRSADEPAAVQKGVDAIVRQAMRDHMRSLIAGDAARVRADFAAEVRERVPQLEATVPTSLRNYDVLDTRLDGDGSHILVRLEGATTVELDWLWRHVDGRFRIVDVTPA